MPDNTTNTSVSFADDIVPIFYKYQKQMMWRFDLTNYDDVKANFNQILGYIKGPNPQMPPPPYPAISKEDVDTFKAWGAGGAFKP